MEKMEQTPIFRKYDINRVVDPVCGEIGSPVPRYITRTYKTVAVIF